MGELGQAGDGFAVINAMGTILSIMPYSTGGNAERMVDRGCKILWFNGLFMGIGTMSVGFADHISSSDATTREQHALHGSPAVATR